MGALRSPFIALFVALALDGCAREPEPRPLRAVEVGALLDRASEESAARGEPSYPGEIVAVHGGYRDYQGAPPTELNLSRYEIVAVDVEFEVPPFRAVNYGQVRGAWPGFPPGNDAIAWQRLDAEGQPSAVIAPSYHGITRDRMLLAFPVPHGTTEITLRYEGRTLTEVPIALDDIGAPRMLGF